MWVNEFQDETTRTVAKDCLENGLEAITTLCTGLATVAATWSTPAELHGNHSDWPEIKSTRGNTSFGFSKSYPSVSESVMRDHELITGPLVPRAGSHACPTAEVPVAKATCARPSAKSGADSVPTQVATLAVPHRRRPVGGRLATEQSRNEPSRGLPSASGTSSMQRPLSARRRYVSYLLRSVRRGPSALEQQARGPRTVVALNPGPTRPERADCGANRLAGDTQRDLPRRFSKRPADFSACSHDSGTSVQLNR